MVTTRFDSATARSWALAIAGAACAGALLLLSCPAATAQTTDDLVTQVEQQTLAQPPYQAQGQPVGAASVPMDLNDREAEPATDQSAISSDQVIDFLEQHPETLAGIRSEFAQQSGVDPATMTDEVVFSTIRQDPAVCSQVIRELVKRGFNLSLNSGTASGDLAGGARQKGSADRRRRGQAQGSQDAAEEPDQSQALPRQSPYGDLPSLRDLYAQFPQPGTGLHRFGSETFRLGTGNASQLPMDLPVGPDYVLGPGDSLVINLWGSQSSQLNRPIDRQGQIALPEAGTLTLAGLTIAQAQKAIGEALGTEFKNEHVEISLGRVRTVRVYVVGDVERPGAYDVSSLSTGLNALYAAGGPTSRGSLRVLRQMRGKELVREIDLYDFLLKGVHGGVDKLEPGDTLLVPPAGAQVTVGGMVRRPAIYELGGERGLKEILDLAGGVLASGSLKEIRVERIEANQRRTMLTVELPQGGAGAGAAGFTVQDGDSILVSQILPASQQSVYLEGHVIRPGKYPYREGMTVADLLGSYRDLMPEPSDHAELVRLRAPDYRPETVIFDLEDALIGNSAIKLEPFDLVRIFSRYEVDAPRVTIQGEVLRPGEYPMPQGMTAAGLVRMAGGLKRSAYREEADLSTYEVEGGRKVQLSHLSIAVGKALDGDLGADVVLKPGDVLGIRQITAWQDIGASVSIRGEVEHPGTYGIVQGERLSSLLKRTGGFRETASPAAADLERIEVRQFNERARQEMIRRIESTPVILRPGLGSSQNGAEMEQAAQQQRNEVLEALKKHEVTGRMVISISADVSKWENTADDVELRSGDQVVIPKRENFVLVSGQVYNATAISYVPGKDAAWYLRQAGGITHAGDAGATFVLRANGSVVARRGNWLNGGMLGVRMRPGDSIIVPEKPAGGSAAWRNLISIAQVMSSVAITGAVAGIF